MAEAADRVLHESHLVTELGGEAHGRFNAGIGPHPDHDDFAHPVLLELKV